MTLIMLLGTIGFSLCLLGCSKLRVLLSFFLLSSVSLIAVVLAYFLLRFVRNRMQSLLATVVLWFLMPRHATAQVARLHQSPRRRAIHTPRSF